MRHAGRDSQHVSRGAAQREAMRCKTGTFTNACFREGPASAAQRGACPRAARSADPGALHRGRAPKRDSGYRERVTAPTHSRRCRKAQPRSRAGSMGICRRLMRVRLRIYGRSRPRGRAAPRIPSPAHPARAITASMLPAAGFLSPQRRHAPARQNVGHHLETRIFS
jgi:hypothetical protein